MPLELPKDRPDDLDRIRSAAADKLLMLCEWCRTQLGRDPRGGGMSFVARPKVVEQLYAELPELLRRLHATVVVGTRDADIVFAWGGVPVRARSNVKDDNVYALDNAILPDSSRSDRQIASRMRWNAARALPMIEAGTAA